MAQTDTRPVRTGRHTHTHTHTHLYTNFLSQYLSVLEFLRKNMACVQMPGMRKKRGLSYITKRDINIKCYFKSKLQLSITSCDPVHPADHDGQAYELLQVIISNMVLCIQNLFIMPRAHRQKIHYEQPCCKKGVIRLYIIYMV